MSGVNGRQSSEAPSSSSSDLYTAREDVPPAPADGNANATPTLPTNGRTTALEPTPVYGDDGDASSDMDVSDSSSSTASGDLQSAHAGAKRKLSDADMDVASTTTGAQDSVKKLKVSLPAVAFGAGTPVVAGWPPELWQQVFMHLSPAMLSRCLRVCKGFNFYLTQLKATTSAVRRNAPTARVMDSEAVWVHSRKHAYTTMPRPLSGFSELRMLQMIGGQTCDSCGKVPTKSPATNVFNAGPGENGVRVIWPFRLRLCGSCFINESLTDIQMLSTKHPAAPLARGLPYAFRTPDGHFIPDHIRQSPQAVPAPRMQKTCHKRDVDSITAELDEVHSFGDGAADEWKKGMTQRGKDAMADSSRWERWEGTLPLGKELAEVLREYDLASFPRLLGEQQRQQRQSTGQFAHVSGALPAPPFHGAHPLPQPVHVFANTQPQSQQHNSSSSQPVPFAQRTVRSAHEVEAARQARRADIERRCLELDPPLHANALQHIKAFRDTMQITTPLTDTQWENMLKPKIIEEREEAELQEHQRAQQLAALQAAIPSAIPDDAYTRPAKEVYDREYEQSQEPLRLKLGEYASDHINGRWIQGRSLDRENVPLFAADVLMHVYQRYETDKDAGILSSILEGAPKFRGSKQSTPPLEPFLSLDNMKWVFDNKVRSYTDPYRRELFICHGCAEERKPKWFAFEGLVQHYGAKHTSAFSKGNVVVHWQTAEWPERPPFVTHPEKFIQTERAERKASHAKGNARSKGTPQASIDDRHHSPAAGATLADNPMFSDGSSTSAAHNGYHRTPQLSGGHAYQYQPAQPRVDPAKHAQVAKIAADAREVWDQLDGVKEFQESLECVRMQTVIHHMVTRFLGRFAFMPNLDLLTDALATNALMKPVKSTHALACKTCVAERSESAAGQASYHARVVNMKMYNISALVTHFKLLHQPNATLEWDRDLIELPDDNLVGELIRKPGMDDNKLSLIAAAFPSAFSWPLPRIGVVKEAPPDPIPDSGLASRMVQKFTKGQQQGKKKKKGQAFMHERNGSIEPSVEPGEDEYDPRRPMFVEKKPAAFDPSRFDTDLVRKEESPKAGTPANFNLAPETLAALSSLQTNAAARPSETQPALAHRSPSIGRPASKGSSSQPAAPTSLPQVTPDIAAILASLTGQTPGTAASAIPSYHGQPRQPYDPYASSAQHASSAHPRPESNRPASRYVSGAGYAGSVEPAPAPAPTRYEHQDLQATLSRNTHHYAQNAHSTYVEPGPAPAPAPVYAAPPPQQRSPPRYRVIYEDEEPGFHPEPQNHHYHRPYDGQPAPVQYVPISDAGMPYRYEQYAPPPPPKKIYVDQYGRPVELVPIDAAPAPVQYMPHPYEQQQQEQHYARPSEYARPTYPGAPPPQQPYSAAPPHAAYQTVYYEEAPPAPAHHQGRYVYDDDDDARGSVPRG